MRVMYRFVGGNPRGRMGWYLKRRKLTVNS
jgi:hypothetical protein